MPSSVELFSARKNETFSFPEVLVRSVLHAMAPGQAVLVFVDLGVFGLMS